MAARLHCSVFCYDSYIKAATYGQGQIHRAVELYRGFRPFSDDEAWQLLRLAAFGEAVGWTLLIAGILCSYLPVSWHDIPVLITGQVHGMLFFFYIAIVLVATPSMRWSTGRTLIAGLCSIPPYGTLFYELWSAHNRDGQAWRTQQSLACYRSVIVGI